MPCDTIQSSTINLGNVGDKALLLKALEGLGYRGEIDGDTITFASRFGGAGTIYADGRVELTGRATQLDENTIKRAYSTEAVKLAAKKFGWSIKQTAENKFVAQRRF